MVAKTVNITTGTLNLNNGFWNVIVAGAGLKTLIPYPFKVLNVLSMEDRNTFYSSGLWIKCHLTIQHSNGKNLRPGRYSPCGGDSLNGGVIIKNTGVITLNGNKTFVPTNAPPPSTSGSLSILEGATLAESTYTITNPYTLNMVCGGLTAGATLSGTGLLTLDGDVFVTSAGHGTHGATISCPVSLTEAIATILPWQTMELPQLT